MFGDIFDTTQELLSGVKEGAVQTSWERAPKSCADQIPMPPKERKKGYPIGLNNQGSTCYLNSLLQILFLTPNLRKMVSQLPLCKQKISQKSQFVSNESKHNFLLGFQRLFAQMALSDMNSVSTEYLTKAFGWDQADHLAQQDIQEAMRIIFDTFQRALIDTPFELTLKHQFKGVFSRYIECRNCTIRTQRFEDFYDITAQINNSSSLSESFFRLISPEGMENGNQVFCQTCNSKQDAWLGTRIKSLPNTLIVCLNRFDFDYQKMDRIKLNSYLSFDLQLNMSPYLQANAGSKNDQQLGYELYGILIHRGSAHGGHYICYIRDLLKQTDWENSLKQAQKNEQKLKKERQNIENTLTTEQKQKKKELEKQNLTYQLKAPQNLNLLQNWFEINDSIVTAIDPIKITSKYEGSQSAYVLFYRRRNAPLPQKIQIHSYFSNIIKQQNLKLESSRITYQNQKQHIILRINGEICKLKVSTKITELIEKYCPIGFVLVNQCIHNGLPYYPLQINSLCEYSQAQTIQSFNIIHDSIWKCMLIQEQQYNNIKNAIGKQKLPFEVNLVTDKKSIKIVLYQNQTLGDLRLKIEKQYQIKYQNQIIKLVTPYKETFVTDDLSNDGLLLTKLGFINEAQLIIKSLNKGSEKPQEDIEEQGQDNLICFIIQRDDQIGIKRMYFDKNCTLDQLRKHIMKVSNIPQDQNRRLRNLDGNRLYYIDHYSISLSALNLGDEMVKLRIQRGDIPIKGDICVKIKMQSQYQTSDTPQLVQKISDPNILISELKQQICNQYKLEANNHKLYLTDWMHEPTRPLIKETNSIFELSFGKEETICLRDNQSPIASELLRFQVFTTVNGSPETISSKSFHIKIQQTKTIEDLKKLILQSESMKDLNIKPGKLRIREVKRDYSYGTIWRESHRILKNIGINSNTLVVQIMPQEENLSQNQIVLLLKKRLVEKRLYQPGVELIFEAGKSPSVEDLVKSVKAKLQFSEQQQIMLFKYFNYEFQWIEISKQTIQIYIKGKSKKTNNKKNQKANKQVRKQQKVQDKIKTQDTKDLTQEEQKPKEKQQSVEASKDKIKQQKQKKQKAQEKQKNKKQPKKKDDKKQTNDVGQENKKEEKIKHKNQNKKQGKKQGKKDDDFMNLKKAPILLKDGDWIGYGIKSQLVNDDLQTDQDLSINKRARIDEARKKRKKQKLRKRIPNES